MKTVVTAFIGVQIGLLSSVGQVFTASFANIGVPIPDGSSSGYVNIGNISGHSGSVQSLSVSLDLSGVGFGGFNGDMYVLLSHNGQSAVLVNRPGKDSSNPFGYDDNGMHVTFSDHAANGDFHLYQSIVGAVGGSVTGTWAPDGRRTDPAVVTSSSPRTGFLENFNGTSVNGAWNLYLVDISGGGQLRLDSWALHFAQVPEPTKTASSVAFGLFAIALLKRSRMHWKTNSTSIPVPK